MSNKRMRFSKYELWFLLTQESPAIIIGFQDPMRGMLKDEMFPLVQEASFSLLDKGLLYADESNLIKIKPELSTLIHTIAAPEHTILIGYLKEHDKKEKVSSLNFDNGRAVLLEEMPDDNYIVQEFDNRDDLLALITEPLSELVFWAPDSDSVHLRQDTMLELQKYIEEKNIEKAKTCLSTLNGDINTRNHLLVSLQDPRLRLSLVGFFDRNDLEKNKVNGFSLVIDEHYIWKIEIVDSAEQLVCVSKTTLKSLKETIKTMIPLDN